MTTATTDALLDETPAIRLSAGPGDGDETDDLDDLDDDDLDDDDLDDDDFDDEDDDEIEDWEEDDEGQA